MRWLVPLLVGIVAYLVLAATSQPTDAASPSPTHVKVYLPEQARNGRLLAPTATPTAIPTPTSVPAPVFLFIEGLTTSSASNDFGSVRAALISRGYFVDEFVNYSYRGADSPYFCDDTFQDFGLDNSYLTELVHEFAGRRIVLVGHSLGGLIAWSELEVPITGIVGIITIDSPLFGVTEGKAEWAEFRGCPSVQRQSQTDTPIGQYLVGLHSVDRSTMMNTRVVEAGNASARGILVRTLGNAYDCVYEPAYCGIPGFTDDEYTQFVNYTDQHFQIANDDIFGSHKAILTTYPDWVAYYADQAARGH